MKTDRTAHGELNWTFLSLPQNSKGNCFQQETEDPTGPGGAQNQKEAWTKTWLEKQVQTKTVHCLFWHNFVLSHNINSAQVCQVVATWLLFSLSGRSCQTSTSVHIRAAQPSTNRLMFGRSDFSHPCCTRHPVSLSSTCFFLLLADK